MDGKFMPFSPFRRIHPILVEDVLVVHYTMKEENTRKAVAVTDRKNPAKGIVLFLIFLCLHSLTSCEEKDDISLRTLSEEKNYATNNRAAAVCLSSIMYNRTDSTNPLERFKLVHISDAHLSDRSSSNHYETPKNLIEAVKFSNQQELQINAIVATGDHISYSSRTEALLYLQSFYKNLFSQNKIPTFPCLGNHDSNINNQDFSNAFSKKELYSAFDNKNNYALKQEDQENYYYADVKNPMGGTVRIIALDMLDQAYPEYNTVYNALFSQKQIDWLCRKALKENMTEQHQVIIITHFPFQALTAKMSNYLIDGSFIHSARLIPEIIEAFREKEPIRESYPNLQKKNDTIYVDTDFSDYKGDFICYMGGHAHVTAQFEINGLRNQSTSRLPQKMLLCTNMSPSEAGTMFNRVKREENTITDNSFCIYAIDTQERNIYITFFGAYLPADKTKTEYPEIQ
ncbi:MAG: metallophosphoesterase, partial [Massilibacteroides sp.]|nr:metallophosphoesterase [Massilibacteroides sp.]